MPEISIILPVYNSERYLKRTITSIQQQTFIDYEVIAIDDGSMDGSAKLLRDWAQNDVRVQVFLNAQNIGVAEVRNKGIAQAQGEYVCFIDSDDTWHSDKLERQLAFMKQNNADFSCTAYAMVDDEGKFIKNRMIDKQVITLEDLLKENYICCSTVMLKANIAKRHRMENACAHEDYVYWLDLLQSGAKGMVLNQVLTRYRLAQTSRSANKGKAAQGRWQIYRQYLNYGVIKSVRYFVQYALNGIKKYS